MASYSSILCPMLDEHNEFLLVTFALSQLALGSFAEQNIASPREQLRQSSSKRNPGDDTVQRFRLVPERIPITTLWICLSRSIINQSIP